MTSLLSTEPLLDDSATAHVTSRFHLRPLVQDDLTNIADLHRRAFGRPVQTSTSLLRRIFFESPWNDGSLSSLACEDHTGQLVGCLGIMPRPMKFRGHAIRAALGHHFIVDASRQGMRAGVALARRFMAGTQDLAVAAGNDHSRRIWEFLGGSVSPLHSFSWTRALRPARYALRFLKLPASVAVTLKLACHAVDATLNIVARPAFALKPPSTLSEDLDVVTMFASFSAFAGNRSLQPIYNVPSLAWLVETLNETKYRGNLHKVAVRTHSGRPLGWYLYYLSPTGVAEVLQVGGKDSSINEVLNHLFYHAWQRGAVAATGPIDARLFEALSETRCVFHRPNHSWTLIHSRDPRIAEAFHEGDVFMSRLEGDWWSTA